VFPGDPLAQTPSDPCGPVVAGLDKVGCFELDEAPRRWSGTFAGVKALTQQARQLMMRRSVHPAQAGLDAAVAEVRARVDRSTANGGSWFVSLFPNWFPEWPAIRKADVPHLVRAAADPGGAAVVLSAHRNGYVREAAIAELTKRDDPLALPALIVRSSDWVDEVRTAAGHAFLTVWRNRATVDQTAAVPLLDHLVSARSRFTTQAVVALDEFFAKVDPNTTQLIDNSDRKVRRVAARRLAKRLSTPRLVAALVHQDDIITARLLAHELTGRDDLSEENLLRLAKSCVGSIRANALVWATRRGVSDLESLLFAGLIDSNAITRSYAQYVLTERGFDVHSWYSTAWAEGNRAALVGLVDVAKDSDRVTAERLMHESNTSLQLAGLRMMSRVARSDGAHTGRLLDIVASSNSKCSRLALGLLTRDDDVLRQLEELAVSSPFDGRRLQLARHLIATDRFTGLAFALRVIISGLPTGTALFDRVDTNWASRHTGPSLISKELLVDRLPGALSRLDTHRQERLLEMVKPYGIVSAEVLAP
jgi:hypothetical protein